MVREGWLTNTFEAATFPSSAGLSTSVPSTSTADATLVSHPSICIDRTTVVGEHHVPRGSKELYTESVAKFEPVFYVSFVVMVDGCLRHG